MQLCRANSAIQRNLSDLLADLDPEELEFIALSSSRQQSLSVNSAG